MRRLIPWLLLVMSAPTLCAPVIFDNDMAIDDWAALLYLLHHPNADIKAITVASSGESRCQPGLSNTASLLDLVPNTASDIAFSCGDSEPLDGYAVFPEPWRVDSDTLSGVPLKPSSRTPSAMHAADLIHHTLMQQTESTVLIATGPLTNIAQWIERYPADIHKVERLVIMGGNLDVKGNIIVPGFTDGHPNTQAEWNIFVDPMSADLVFASDLNIELVGLDVTNSVRVTSKVAADFKRQVSTPAAQFWDDVLDKNDWFIESGEYYFWDTLAALIAMYPELCQGDFKQLKVRYELTQEPYLNTSDLTMSGTRWDGKPRQHLNAQSAGVLVPVKTGSMIKVCRTTDANYVFENFRQTLNGQTPKSLSH
ncbi:nucleoside hydrolase [Echinimonas agarilytica]|uniref:Nucleoside hydrolase n=1 Tax=Echinimonas agarilytica TaxID=1215918 RepID=A0AA41W6X0_9GAMM|nr:nucleoside hydrolase [Echinimonas agarilytica]MCM2680205.1 nucleoside hydrolase [Echinimonas agarilytica]